MLTEIYLRHRSVQANTGMANVSLLKEIASFFAIGRCLLDDYQEISGFEKHQIFDKKGQPLYVLVGLNYFRVDVIVMRML